MQEEAPNNGYMKKSSNDLIADAYAAIGAPREQTEFSIHSGQPDNVSSLRAGEISQTNERAVDRPESLSEQQIVQQCVPLGVPQSPGASSPTPQKPLPIFS